MKEPYRVFLTGPPAAGKTTLVPTITRWFADRGLVLPYLSIEDCIRELYAPEVAPESASYARDGSLVLLNREEQVPRAIDLLAAKCSDAARTGGFVAEIADPKLGAVLLQQFVGLLEGSLVLFLSAPRDVRAQRNEMRTELWMPRCVVEGGSERLSAEELTLLRQQGAKVRMLRTDGDRSEVEDELLSVLENVVYLGYRSDDLET